MRTPNMTTGILRWLVPRFLRSGSASRSSITIIRHLLMDYGWLQSVNQQQCIMNGAHVPWFTYPAIEFLRQLDLSEKTVFEWGSGYSTVFWSSRAKKVVSIETDPKWHELVQKLVGKNVVLILSEVIPGDGPHPHRSRSTDAYIDHINKFDNFDIIVI